MRPLFVEMYEAPNSEGDPLGCCGGGTPKTDCGTKSRASGVYVNPLGGIHHWRGFTLELESEPPPFSRCGLAGAQRELPDPLQIEVKAPPARLTGSAPKLAFRGKPTSKASDRDGNTPSSATGKLSYTVKLVRDR